MHITVIIYISYESKIKIILAELMKNPVFLKYWFFSKTNLAYEPFVLSNRN